MKNIALALALALAFGLGAIGLATPADAQKSFNNARWVACWKQVNKARTNYGFPSNVQSTSVDRCYRGRMW